MKTKIYILVLVFLAAMGILNAQTETQPINVKLSDFNFYFWNAYATKLQLSPADRNEFLSSHQKNNIDFQQKQNTPTSSLVNLRGGQQANILSTGCTNIDFENGTLSGWVPWSGFHPLYAANPSGCCLNPGGQQTIMTGAGLDPAGNFPVVAPGGNFSLRLGNNQTGGQADRIEQTFLVTPTNANFTYRYAVVMEDPGHLLTQQPSFQVEMLDSIGAQIPCTFYNVAAGNNIPGFINSTTMANVVYKPWSSVVADLTNLIGQNITIRFTTRDCALGGHFGYAYLDGSCLSFVKGSNDTICAGAQKQYCAPNGFLSTTWNGPGIINNTNQCINASAPGVYTCQTVLIPGCPGPDFTYTLSNFPTPTLAFNSISNNACSPQYTFINTSTISAGFINSFNWSFGNNISSTLSNPIITYQNSGIYTVSLSATSNFSCMSTTTATLVIHPLPIISFSATNVCLGDTTLFINTNSISSGNIIAFSWNFGDGYTSSANNPLHTFLSGGNKLITLTATSNQNCITTYTQNLMINPLPLVSFSVNNVCHGNNCNFINNTNISAGNILNWTWDFGNTHTVSGMSNPVYQYPSPGIYTVILKATSNKNCSNRGSSIVKIFANPTASFVTNNVCLGEISTFTNLSTIANSDLITSYSWNMGNGNNSNFLNPVQTYSNPGNYTVNLTVGSANNCSASFQKPITVYALPVVAFLPSTACKNQATQFTNLSSLTAGIISKCRWDFENDGNWDDTLNINPIITYPNHGNYLCKLEVESSFQCKNSKTKNVEVHANPVADFMSRAVCLGDVTTFTNKSTSVDDVITNYLWDFNGDNVIDNRSQNAVYTYSANGTYLVKLEVQTQFGCSNVKSKSGHINAMPVPGFVSKNNKGCPALPVNFQNTSSISTGSIVSTLWSFGDGSPTDYSQNPKHSYNVGNYNVTLKLISDSGCTNSLTQQGFVNVFPKPVAGFMVEPNEIDETEPIGNIQSIAQNAVFTSYFINDGSRWNTPNFTHTFKNLSETKPMIVQIVKNEFGCADTSMEILKVKPAFVIYIPNTFTPNGDGLNDNFQAKGVGITKFNMQIFDRWGHVLYETADILTPWDGTVRGGDQPIMQEVYVWKAQVTDLFNKNHDLTGHVSVIR